MASDFILIFSKGHNSRKGGNSNKKKKNMRQLFFHKESIRATENRFFAGPDRFLVCKTDSVCIKRFFLVRKNTLCGSYIGPIIRISQVSNR